MPIKEVGRDLAAHNFKERMKQSYGYLPCHSPARIVQYYYGSYEPLGFCRSNELVVHRQLLQANGNYENTR